MLLLCTRAYIMFHIIVIQSKSLILCPQVTGISVRVAHVLTSDLTCVI